MSHRRKTNHTLGFNRWSVAPQPAFAWCENISAYAIGGVAAFWLIERSLSFVA
jgi:hypothetical protein